MNVLLLHNSNYIPASLGTILTECRDDIFCKVVALYLASNKAGSGSHQLEVLLLNLHHSQP
jgi:hypothetical protein